MPFRKATKSLAKQLDPQGDLIPVCSVIDQDRYRPLCLVQQKMKSSWWKNQPFHKTEYRLTDVLLSKGHAAELDIEDGSQYTIMDQVDGKVEGYVDGRDIIPTGAENIASWSHARSVKVKRIQVNPTVLDSVTKKAKINMDHEFIKQSKEYKRNLYVVTEAVETVEETQFDASNKIEGGIFYGINVKLRLKGSRDSRKAITIPKSCILAFRAKRLLLGKQSLGISYYSKDTERLCCSRICSPEDTEERTMVAEDDVEDPKEDLQVEAKQECTQFSLLSSNEHDVFLIGFLAAMRDKKLLQELELQLEEALEDPGQCKLKADKPELQGLVENLKDSSGAIITDLAGAVLYFLGALDELEEEQLMLLGESVEKKIVSKQLELVKNILDNNASDREVNFTVDAKLLTEEDLILTGAMIEMSGVTIQKTEAGLTGTGEPEAFSGLCALYVGLYVLSLLTA